MGVTISNDGMLLLGVLAETKAGEGGGGKSMYHARFMKLSWSFRNG